MPVTVEKAHGQVLVLSLVAPWTVDELMSQFPKETEIYDAASGPVYSIVNISQIGTIPSGALRARVSPMVTHERSHQVIIVGAKGVARTLAETVFKLTRFNKVCFFDSETQAWEYLNPLLQVTT